MIASSCFNDGRNKMYIVRGVGLLIAAIFVPAIIAMVTNPKDVAIGENGYNYMGSALTLLVAVVLIILSIGQLQYAYYLHGLHRLLQEVAGGRTAFQFRVNTSTVASVMVTAGRYRVELLDKQNLDFTIFIVTATRIEARKLSHTATVVPANKSEEFHQITFDEEPFAPDYREEMHRLRGALLSHVPIKGSFTP